MDYTKRDYRMIPIKLLQDIIVDFYANNSCSSTVLHYKDKSYHTDVGYAFDGIYMILDILESELDIKLMPDDVVKEYKIRI